MLTSTALDHHIWAFEYKNVAHLLKAAKYKQEFYHYRYLVDYLANEIYSEYDFVTCVPTSNKHINKRGFDHSEYLAKLVAKKLHLKYKALLSQAHDFVQVQSTLKLRHNLPRYICDQQLQNKRILLIDDVATTKTSLDRCAQTLKKCGAKCVDGATLAYQPYKYSF